MADTFDTVKKRLQSVQYGVGTSAAPDERSLVSRGCGCAGLMHARRIAGSSMRSQRCSNCPPAVGR
jgi:hypothetical protein